MLPMENQNKQSLDFWIVCSTPRMIVDQGILSNCNSDICCLCCPTKEFCGNSTGINEMTVDGLPANVGIGNVPQCCLSSPVKKFCPCNFWNWSTFSLYVVRLNSLRMISVLLNVENWLPKAFSCNPDVCHVFRGKRLSLLSTERELGIIAGWLETWDNLPPKFYSASWNSPESFIEFICSCMSCNWEVSLCIVSWLSLNFFVLRIRELVVLALSSFLPFRAYFGSECLGELFPS